MDITFEEFRESIENYDGIFDEMDMERAWDLGYLAGYSAGYNKEDDD